MGLFLGQSDQLAYVVEVYMPGPQSEWLVKAVSDFGEACKEKLAGPGDSEAAIRRPLEDLLQTAGTKYGLKKVVWVIRRGTNRARMKASDSRSPDSHEYWAFESVPHRSLPSTPHCASARHSGFALLFSSTDWGHDHRAEWPLPQVSATASNPR
jgi:hypothetical protein